MCVLSLQVQLVVLVCAFVVVSTVRSVSCLLFFYSRYPRAQKFLKAGALPLVPCGVGAATHNVTEIHPSVCFFLLSDKHEETEANCYGLQRVASTHRSINVTRQGNDF